MVSTKHQCCLFLTLNCITMFVQEVSSFEGNWNHLNEDIKIRLPAPFLVSTSLGVIPEKDLFGPRSFGSGKIEKIISDKSEPTFIQGHNILYNYQNGEMQKYVNSQSVHENSPKIKFYTMNCTMGHQCNAIIPAHTTTPSPLRRNPIRSDEEMRNYLKKYGLDNGFNYADDDRANRNSVVARYFKGEEEKLKNAREGKKISSSFYDNRDFWPGSQYRPKRDDFNNQPKAKIYKYEAKSARDIHNRNKQNYDWDSIQTVSGVDSNIQHTQELPSPSFSNPKKYPYSKEYPKEYPKHGITSKGLWNRFSNSMVSHYDRKKNDWVQISESNKDLGSGSVTVSSKPTDRFPPKSHHSPSKAVGVTVLDPFSEAVVSHYGNSYNRPVRPTLGYHKPSSNDLPTRPSYTHNEVTSNHYRPQRPSSSHHRPQRPSSSHHESNSHYEPPKHSYNYNEPHSYFGVPKPSSSYYESDNNNSPPKPQSSYDEPNSYDRPPKPSSISHNEPGSYGRPFPPPSPTAKSVSFPLRVLPKKYNSPSIAFPSSYIPSSITYDPPGMTYGPPNIIYGPPSLAYGPPILIDSNFTLVTENHTTDTQEETVTTELSTTTTTHTPIIINIPRTTTTEKPRQENLQDGGGGGGGGLIGNRYAVMAAVGAGLIPASLAALLPVIVGRKRRRRSTADRRSSPPSNLSSAVNLPSDPLVTLLLSKIRHNSHSFR